MIVSHSINSHNGLCSRVLKKKMKTNIDVTRLKGLKIV